jgi:hypothetical protein
VGKELLDHRVDSCPALEEIAKHNFQWHKGVSYPILHRKLPWSWLHIEDPRATVQWPVSPFVFPVLFPLIQVGYKYLLSTHYMPGIKPNSWRGTEVP